LHTAACMKAVRIQNFGGPEQVRIEEVLPPEVGPGQVLVEVRAAGVNPVDWMIRERIYNPEGADKVPLTLGQDFAGIVRKIGPWARPPSVGRLREGTAVLGEAWGTFAELVAVPASDLVEKPESIDFVTAAALPMPALTAWHVVVDTAHAGTGKHFLVHGASGGVGSLAAQFARLHGAEVTVTAGPESFGYLRSAGIDDIIDYRSQRFEDRGRAFDVVVDPLGGDLQRRSLEVLRPGGLLINLVGQADQAAAEERGLRAVDFGMQYDTVTLREIVRLVSRGEVKPHVSKVMSLADARRAMDMNQRGQSHGKIVLQVA
jgi:NADPH:quinone reductase-like Zn-dependent oxidoreductase